MIVALCCCVAVREMLFLVTHLGVFWRGNRGPFAVCCSVLQCAAVCCSVLQVVAVC